jgi:hypothetical protein
MEKETKVTGFNANERLLESLLCCLKTKWFSLTKTFQQWKGLKEKLHYMMKYFQLCKDIEPPQTSYIDALDNVMCRFWGSRIKKRDQKLPVKLGPTTQGTGRCLS